ncbi:MAG: hypothetical protein ACRC10_03310 [Thermoguttaceae bacterium]
MLPEKMMKPIGLTTEILAPIEIWEVLLDDCYIKFHQPLILQPYWLPDEPDDNEYLAVTVPTLNISAFGSNRDELLSCVRGDIVSSWKRIVRIPDADLSMRGRGIKSHYLQIAEEIKRPACAGLNQSV